MTKISLNDYSVSFRDGNKTEYILKNINIKIEDRDTLAIIGESGSGKTTIARSIIGLLDKKLKVESGEILFDGKNVFTANEKDKQAMRGKRISILPQESLNVLDPLIKIGKQIEEVISIKNKKDSYANVLNMLSLCGFKEPEAIFNKYPHELSGGNRQKVLFAISNIGNPEVLIADEPTSSLDFGSEKEILELLGLFKEKYKQTIIFITHDISIARQISNKIVVLKSGEIIETGKTTEVFLNPKEEYTKLLIKNAKTFN